MDNFQFTIIMEGIKANSPDVTADVVESYINSKPNIPKHTDAIKAAIMAYKPSAISSTDIDGIIVSKAMKDYYECVPMGNYTKCTV